MTEARDRLPRVYAMFLTLRDGGLDDADIADRLGVPVESLPLLARLAEAKAARLSGVKGRLGCCPIRALEGNGRVGLVGPRLDWVRQVINTVSALVAAQ